MRKLAAALSAVMLVALCVQTPVQAMPDDTEVVGVHGGRTYLGTCESWSQRHWEEDDFKDVTGRDIDSSETLMIRSGTVGDVSVDEGADLVIYGGTMAKVECGGDIDLFAGTADSLSSGGNINLRGGTVKGDVEADGSVELIGTISADGNVSGKNVSVYASGANHLISVAGSISFSKLMTLEGSKYHFAGIDGQTSGTLSLRASVGTLPPLTDVDNVQLESGSKAVSKDSLDLYALSLGSDSQFAVLSKLDTNLLSGPGTLIIPAGSLTVHAGVSGVPVLGFNGSAADGATAFTAKTGAVPDGGVIAFGYDLTAVALSGGYENYILKPAVGTGITLDQTSVAVKSGQPVTVRATVPSNLPEGAELCWKLTDPSSKFRIEADSENHSCRVSLSDSRNAGSEDGLQATLAAYLVNVSGKILNAKSGLCLLFS